MHHSKPHPGAIPQLVIPPPAVAQHPETITGVRALKTWLRNLPSANPARQAEQLHHQLKLLVRTPDSGLRFTSLLELYHPYIGELQALVNQNLMQLQQGSAEATLYRNASQLTLEAACGHMRMINRNIALGKPPLSTHLFNALLALARLLHWDIAQYNLTRPSIWRQMLQLYAIGELYQQLDSPQSSAMALTHDPNTSHSIFFATLALLLSDPHRLPRQQLLQLIERIGSPADFLRLSDRPEASHRLPVDLSGKTPPLRYARGRSAAQQKGRCLDLDDFLKQLQNPGLADDPANLGDWLAHSLTTLAAPKTGRDARRHPRRRHEADYHYVQGLSDIQRQLSEIQTSRPPPGPVAQDTILISDGPRELLGNLGIPCQQLDISSGGACLLISGSVPAPPVGCWLLLELDSHSAEHSQKGFVAQVRRCMRFDTRGTEIGVERLRGSIAPVVFGLEHHPALLHLDRQAGIFEVIAPTGVFRGPGEYTLNGPNKNYRVRFESLRERHTTDRIQVSLI